MLRNKTRLAIHFKLIFLHLLPIDKLAAYSGLIAHKSSPRLSKLVGHIQFVLLTAHALCNKGHESSTAPPTSD